MATVTITCNRCNGKGTYSYCPRYGTMCFKCQGAGKVQTTTAAIKATQKRQAKAAAQKVADDKKITERNERLAPFHTQLKARYAERIEEMGTDMWIECWFARELGDRFGIRGAEMRIEDYIDYLERL